MVSQVYYYPISCPLCEYTTGINKWSKPEWAEQSARNALVNHLCRKRHGLTRLDAREKARAAERVTMVYSFTKSAFVKARWEEPRAQDAGATPSAEGATESAQESSSSSSPTETKGRE